MVFFLGVILPSLFVALCSECFILGRMPLWLGELPAFQRCVLGKTRELWPLFVGRARAQSDTQVVHGGAFLTTMVLMLAGMFTDPAVLCAELNQLIHCLE